MESYKGGLKGYWKRRTAGKQEKRRVRRAELGGGPRRRWFWRIKVSPRFVFLRRAAATPVRILARIRDAYVRMMLSLANAGPAGIGCGGYGFGAGPRAAFPAPPLKEYDEKVLVQFYRSLLAQGTIVASTDGGEVGALRQQGIAPH